MLCGLYVHIPFCIKKCAYCDFVSASASQELHEEYFKALKKEIARYKGIPTDTIFIGGGTPSCVDEHYIYDLFKTINKNMRVYPNAEITIEANPGTLTGEKLNIYKSCGINRISLGAQSMQDNELAFLGRIHNASQTIEAVNLIQKAGFTNYNLDLMLAIPGQTLQSLDNTLRKAISLSPSHISAYSLIVEENTEFYELSRNGKLILPDEDTERKMYEHSVSFLENNGYYRYEISNFAKDNLKCKHNLKYWNCRPYIGVGVSAHSYYDDKRCENVSDTNAYIAMINEKNNAVEYEQTISFDNRVVEYIIMALRLANGICFDDFYKKFGFSFEEKYKNIIDKYTSLGLFAKTKTHICFTADGVSVSNSILCEFV